MREWPSSMSDKPSPFAFLLRIFGILPTDSTLLCARPLPKLCHGFASSSASSCPVCRPVASIMVIGIMSNTIHFRRNCSGLNCFEDSAFEVRSIEKHDWRIETKYEQTWNRLGFRMAIKRVITWHALHFPQEFDFGPCHEMHETKSREDNYK